MCIHEVTAQFTCRVLYIEWFNCSIPVFRPFLGWLCQASSVQREGFTLTATLANKCQIFSNLSWTLNILSTCFLNSDDLIGSSLSLLECSHFRLKREGSTITLFTYAAEASLLILISKPATIYTAQSVRRSCPNLVINFDTLYVSVLLGQSVVSRPSFPIPTQHRMIRPCSNCLCSPGQLLLFIGSAVSSMNPPYSDSYPVRRHRRVRMNPSHSNGW